MDDDINRPPEEILRALLKQGRQPVSIPPARHKRFARRAMRRKKSAEWRAAHHNASLEPGPPTQTHRVPLKRIESLPEVDLKMALSPDVEQTDLQRLADERERHAQTIHRLRKEAADAKREVRFVKAELRRAQERENKLRQENLRLRAELADLHASRVVRERAASEVLPKANSDQEQTGS